MAGQGGSFSTQVVPGLGPNARITMNPDMIYPTNGQQYRVTCSNEDFQTQFTTFWAPGFSVNPSATTIYASRVLVTLATSTQDQAKCCAYLTNDLNPSNAQAVFNSNSNMCSQQTNTQALNNAPLTVTGLVTNTGYKIFCATQSGVLSNSFLVTTHGFTSKPVLQPGTEPTETGLQMQVQPNFADTAKCIAVLNGANNLNAQQIMSGSAQEQGSANPSQGQTQVNVQFKTSFTNLKAGTDYEIRCASTGDALSDILLISTQGLAVPPQLVSAGCDNAKVSLTVGKSTSVVCSAYTRGSTKPTGQQVYSKQGNGYKGGSQQVATQSGVSVTVTVPGLESNKQYDIYCSTQEYQASINPVQAETKGFVGDTPRVTYDTTQQNWKAEITAGMQDNVRCCAWTSPSQPPPANVVFNNFCNGAASSPASQNVQQNGVGTFYFTNLPGNGASYDVYCMMSCGAVSNIASFTPTYFSSPLTIVSVTDTTFTVRTAVNQQVKVQCTAFSFNSGSKTGQTVYNKVGAAFPPPNGQLYNNDVTVQFTGASPSTQYDVYCATEQYAVTNIVQPETTGFTQISVTGSLTAQCDVSATYSAAANVVCRAYSSGYTPNSANEIYNGGSAMGDNVQAKWLLAIKLHPLFSLVLNLVPPTAFTVLLHLA